MKRAELSLRCFWLTGLIFLLGLGLASQLWGQPGGMGRGGLMGGGGMGGPGDEDGPPGAGKGRRRQAPPRFDLHQATTITGKVEDLGSYGRTGWRSMPGLAVQGLILKTNQGNIEVYLGPPSYVAEQKFTLLKGDALEVHGFKVLREQRAAFYAAKIKRNNQTLKLLDEHGSPLWKQQDSGGPGTERAGRRGRNSDQMGGGMMGSGNMGWGR